jgi:hypothetical protein
MEMIKKASKKKGKASLSNHLRKILELKTYLLFRKNLRKNTYKFKMYLRTSLLIENHLFYKNKLKWKKLTNFKNQTALWLVAIILPSMLTISL